MIDFFNKRILYFSTFGSSYGDGINLLKAMYSILHDNAYRTLFHINMNSNTLRQIGWMIHRDNLTDRIYTHHELDDHVDYTYLYNNVKYDEVYFGHTYIKNFNEVFEFFYKTSNCYSTITYTEYEKYNLYNIFQNKDTSKYFKQSFNDQKKEILKLIDTEKIAILMPFSTRKYAIPSAECVLGICQILIDRGYTVLLCGEYPNPYLQGNEMSLYDKEVHSVINILKEFNSNKIINLLGMNASKTSQLAEHCNVILYASTGAIQMSSYGYSNCPFIILENGREGMMNELSKMFSNVPYDIVDVTCTYKYCEQYFQDIEIPDKVNVCRNSYSKCISEEFNYNKLIELLEKIEK